MWSPTKLDFLFYDFSINFILNYIILYVQCVDLLMWSPTKLNFLFYDFSIIYNNFLKSQLIFLKKRQNHGYCSKPRLL